MKAVLVALNAKYIHSNLGVYCLYAYSRKKGISSDELVYREFTINQEMDDILGALYKEKPDLIISCGAAVAVPFFYIGKMMGAKLVYIEVFDRIDKPTMTGKMVYPIVDKFVVQWEEQKKVYPKAVNLGSIF